MFLGCQGLGNQTGTFVSQMALIKEFEKYFQVFSTKIYHTCIYFQCHVIHAS